MLLISVTRMGHLATFDSPTRVADSGTTAASLPGGRRLVDGTTTLMKPCRYPTTERSLGEYRPPTNISLAPTAQWVRGHPFMTSTRRGRGSGSGGRMWTGGGGPAPCGRPHRKLKLES